MELEYLVKIAGDDVRFCITRLQDAAMSLGKCSDTLAVAVPPVVHLLWQLSEHARYAESEIAKIHKELRDGETRD